MCYIQPLPIMQHEKLETSATLREEKYDDLAEAAKDRVERTAIRGARLHIASDQFEEPWKVYESMINTNVIGATIVTREGSKFFDHTKVRCFVITDPCFHINLFVFVVNRFAHTVWAISE